MYIKNKGNSKNEQMNKIRKIKTLVAKTQKRKTNQISLLTVNGKKTRTIVTQIQCCIRIIIYRNEPAQSPHIKTTWFNELI